MREPTRAIIMGEEHREEFFVKYAMSFVTGVLNVKITKAKTKKPFIIWTMMLAM